MTTAYGENKTYKKHHVYRKKPKSVPEAPCRVRCVFFRVLLLLSLMEYTLLSQTLNGNLCRFSRLGYLEILCKVGDITKQVCVHETEN